MFLSLAGSADRPAKRPRFALPASIAAHGILLAWLLHSPSPVFIAPSSVLGGVGGSTVTHLYWPTAGDSSHAENHASRAANRKMDRSAQAKLVWKKSSPTELASNRDPAPAAETAGDDHAGAANPGATAGSTYGSLSQGSDEGHEVRAALPIVTFEPAVDRAALTGGEEGNCVVEIVIDESGAVVGASVVQSLGPAIDGPVLAAVSRWKFRPATRDGVPIPSRQDVVYHFKPR